MYLHRIRDSNLLHPLQVPALSDVEKKWQSVFNHLEAAPTGNMDQIFLTYSSGAGLLAYPRAVALRVHPKLYDYLSAKTDRKQRLGIICMDFPAAPLIQMIIDFQVREVSNTAQSLDSVPIKVSLKYSQFLPGSGMTSNYA